MISQQIDGQAMISPALQRHPEVASEAEALREELERLLVQRGFIQKPVPFESLHEWVAPEHQEIDIFLLNGLSKSFYETSEAFRKIYFSIIKKYATQILKKDVIFQEVPTVRFHFPGKVTHDFKSKMGPLLAPHVDSMYGHSFKEINLWLTLTNSVGSSTVQMMPLKESVEILKDYCDQGRMTEGDYFAAGSAGFYTRLHEDSKMRDAVIRLHAPVPVKRHEMLSFDCRCLHSTAENNEDTTRVSLDFRVIPVDVYEAMPKTYKSSGKSGRKFTRGDVFFERTAFEV